MSTTTGFLQPILGHLVPWLYAESRYWTAFGLLGNVLFSSRFFIQWLQTERSKKLVVPPIFWHLSFWGSVISLIYALHIDKIPIILGFVFLPFVYARNLYFLRREIAHEEVTVAEKSLDQTARPSVPEEPVLTK